MFFLSIALPVCGQQVHHLAFSASKGLQGSSIFDITQDKEGRLWIATENGIAWFEGDQFHTIDMDAGLPDATVFNLYCDSKGRIWFTCSNGQIGYWYQGKIETGKSNSAVLAFNKLSNNWVRGLAEDSLGNLWIVLQTSEVWRIKGNKAENLGMVSGQIRSEVYINEKGLAWLVVQEGVICLSDNPFKLSLKVDFGSAQLGLCTFYQNHLVYLKGRKLMFVDLKTGEPTLEVEKSNIKEISKFRIDRYQNLWASDIDSAYVLDKPLNKRPTRMKAINLGLKTASIFFDSYNQLWLGSLTQGLFLFPDLENRYYKHVLAKPERHNSLLTLSNERWLVTGDDACVSVVEGNGHINHDLRFRANLRGRSRMTVVHSVSGR